MQNNLLEDSTQPIETQYYYVNSFDVELEVQGPIQTAIPQSARNFNYQSGTVSPGTCGHRRSVVGRHQAGVGAPRWSALSGVASPGSIIMHVRPVSTRGENQVVGAFATFPIDVLLRLLVERSRGWVFVPRVPVVAPRRRPPGNACNIAQDVPIDCCNPTLNNSDTSIKYDPKAAVCGSDAKPTT